MREHGLRMPVNDSWIAATADGARSADRDTGFGLRRGSWPRCRPRVSSGSWLPCDAWRSLASRRGDRVLRAARRRQLEDVLERATRRRSTSAVKAPMIELCEELAEYGPFRLFRPYNDLRFAKDRPPYKTAAGRVRRVARAAPATTSRSRRPGCCAAPATTRWRRISSSASATRSTAEHTGAEIAAHLRRGRRAGNSVGAIDELKTAPRATRRTIRASTCCAARD